MAEFAQVHPLGDLNELVAAHRFDGIGDAPVTISIHGKTNCAQLFASKGNEEKLATKLKISSKAGRSSSNRNYTALPLSPGQWMLAAKDPSADLPSKMARSVGKLGYLSQQSDSRICVRVSGPMALQLLSRGCRLDLSGEQAGSGFCAQTIMAQVGVLLNQLDDSPTFDLYVYSGFARSFFDWLCHSAEQFGYEVSVINT